MLQNLSCFGGSGYSLNMVIQSPSHPSLFFCFFFGLAAIFGGIAYFTSNRLENEIFSTELEETKAAIEPVKPKPLVTQEGLRLGLKILVIIIVVFIVGELFQWLIYE